MKNLLLFVFFVGFGHSIQGQQIYWLPDGNSYAQFVGGEIIQHDLVAGRKTTLLSKDQLTPKGSSAPLSVEHFSFAPDKKKILLFTNTKRVWRIKTKGDYWIMDLTTGSLSKVGATRPASSLMFAKFSPDGSKIAYVSEYNIYVEDLSTQVVKALTTNGHRRFINGTFDWVYEEEFYCRDGFRWSPDGKSIAYWQIDAAETRDFMMINTTDSIYSFTVPVEYPKVGRNPSACKIGVVDIATSRTNWLSIPGDPKQHYIVRMEWIPGKSEILIQQLNRKQNESKLMICPTNGTPPTLLFSESDKAWIEIVNFGDKYNVAFTHSFIWLENGRSFLWTSENDGWSHLYVIGLDGRKHLPVTPEAFDVIELKSVDEKNGLVYFLASPSNATQKYLYQKKLNGKGDLKRITPADQSGTHDYAISPGSMFARHSFSNTYTQPLSEFIRLPKHEAVNPSESISEKLKVPQAENVTDFFKITTEDGVEMDGWMVKPIGFDESKKYPVVFFVYSEPAGQTVVDQYGASLNYLYAGDMRKDGYIYISLDNRGTPVPKGNAWRKSIYRKIGDINIRDQAMAAKKIISWPFVDPERIAVWGWSGGGTATLNLMFRYPEIYKTGISIAAVVNQLTYDNIYQERYMGLPQENKEDFINNSPITFARNLQGNLLYIHGTGDDNVHYQNAELLLNELIRYNKQFQFMAYPNRSHSISEGDGTYKHLSTLYTAFLKKYCPPGGK